MIKIGGSLKLAGECIEWIEKVEGGGLGLACTDSGSGETTIEFSPESARRLSEAVLAFAAGHKESIHFKSSNGTFGASGFLLMLDDQPIIFSEVDDDPGPEVFPTLGIKLVSSEGAPEGLEIVLNEAQALELRRRLDGYLRAIELRREIAKPRRIDPPAKPKRPRVKAA